MREYVSGLFLILDSRKYTDDIAFLGISPFEGQQTIVVKGGNRETSQRGRALDIGNAQDSLSDPSLQPMIRKGQDLLVPTVHNERDIGIDDYSSEILEN